MKAMISQIEKSPYRDLKLYPIMPEIIAILKPSIEKTGFWGGLRARPKNNVIDLGDGNVLDTEEAINEYLMGLDAAFDENGKPLFPVEAAFGHHRLAAAVECGVEEAEFSITFIGNDIMLKMMAEENHRDASNNIAVKLETYRQTRNELESQLSEFEEFDDYAEKYSFFKKQGWKNARSQGVGHKTIHKFLGESWVESDVRRGIDCIKLIDEDVYEQEQVIRMPGMSMVQYFGNLAKTIRDTDWPEFFKDSYIQDISAYICAYDDDKTKGGTTIKVMTKAIKLVKGEKDKDDVVVRVNPVLFIQSQKKQVWTLESAVKDIAKRHYESELDSLMEVDGLKDVEGLAEVIAKIDADATKAAEREAAKEAGDVVPDDNEASPDITDEADGIIASAEADVAGGDVALPPLADDVPEGEVSVTALAATFVESAQTFAIQSSRLGGMIDDMDSDTADAFGSAFENVFCAIAKVGLEAYGKDDLLKMLDDANVGD